MTNLLTEELRLLVEAAREIPGRPHISTVTRWYLKGVKGVRLETVMIGGRRSTSREAIQRFIARLSDARSEAGPQRSTIQNEGDRQADEELTRLGI